MNIVSNETKRIEMILKVSWYIIIDGISDGTADGKSNGIMDRNKEG